jgi:hypothetical protein
MRCGTDDGFVRWCCMLDLIRHDGEGLRNLPLIDRKRRLAS